MVELKTVPNECRCNFTEEEHELAIEDCCPVSHNPRPSSVIKICYEPDEKILEVVSLRAYLDSYKGGRGCVRSMEGMIQQIAQDVANVIGTDTKVSAELLIDPGQKMHLTCYAFTDVVL